jgi:hypothetical protein
VHEKAAILRHGSRALPVLASSLLAQRECR